MVINSCREPINYSSSPVVHHPLLFVVGVKVMTPCHWHNSDNAPFRSANYILVSLTHAPPDQPSSNSSHLSPDEIKWGTTVIKYPPRFTTGEHIRYTLQLSVAVLQLFGRTLHAPVKETSKRYFFSRGLKLGRIYFK